MYSIFLWYQIKMKKVVGTIFAIAAFGLSGVFGQNNSCPEIFVFEEFSDVHWEDHESSFGNNWYAPVKLKANWVNDPVKMKFEVIGDDSFIIWWKLQVWRKDNRFPSEVKLEDSKWILENIWFYEDGYYTFYVWLNAHSIPDDFAIKLTSEWCQNDLILENFNKFWWLIYEVETEQEEVSVWKNNLIGKVHVRNPSDNVHYIVDLSMQWIVDDYSHYLSNIQIIDPSWVSSKMRTNSVSNLSFWWILRTSDRNTLELAPNSVTTFEIYADVLLPISFSPNFLSAVVRWANHLWMQYATKNYRGDWSSLQEHIYYWLEFNWNNIGTSEVISSNNMHVPYWHTVHVQINDANTNDLIYQNEYNGLVWFLYEFTKAWPYELHFTEKDTEGKEIWKITMNYLLQSLTDKNVWDPAEEMNEISVSTHYNNIALSWDLLTSDSEQVEMHTLKPNGERKNEWPVKLVNWNWKLRVSESWEYSIKLTWLTWWDWMWTYTYLLMESEVDSRDVTITRDESAFGDNEIEFELKDRFDRNHSVELANMERSPWKLRFTVPRIWRYDLRAENFDFWIALFEVLDSEDEKKKIISDETDLFELTWAVPIDALLNDENPYLDVLLRHQGESKYTDIWPLYIVDWKFTFDLKLEGTYFLKIIGDSDKQIINAINAQKNNSLFIEDMEIAWFKYEKESDTNQLIDFLEEIAKGRTTAWDNPQYILPEEVTNDSATIAINKRLYNEDSVIKYRVYYASTSLASADLSSIADVYIEPIDHPNDSDKVLLKLENLKENQKYFVMISPIQPGDIALEPLWMMTDEISFTTLEEANPVPVIPPKKSLDAFVLKKPGLNAKNSIEERPTKVDRSQDPYWRVNETTYYKVFHAHREEERG